MNKSEYLQWLQAEHQQWQALLDQIGPGRMEQPGVAGDWSMKDVVAHLAGWQSYMTARLQAAQRGEAEPPPPWPAHLQADDEVNAWLYAANRGRSVEAVLAEARQGLDQLRVAVESLPADVRLELLHEPGHVFHLVCLGDQRLPAGEFFYHFHDDHEPGIRDWLTRLEKTA